MDTPICQLTIVCPRNVCPALADCLDAIEPPVEGYTIIDSVGRGPQAELSSAAEKVSGEMRSRLFLLVVPIEFVDTVLHAIRSELSAPHIAYWISPISDFGRLA